ncbi:MAG: type II secretion system protein GspM [Candidatus Deferrimicrobium sp.]
MSVVAAIRDRWFSLSSRERLYLVAGFVAMAGFALLKWGILPARAAYLRDRAAIPVRGALLARYKAIQRGRAAVDNAVNDLEERLQEWEKTLLPGDTAPAAGIALQEVLKPILSKSPTRVTSLRTVPPVKKGEYAEIPVQVDLQTTTAGLATLLADLGGEGRIARIDRLTVSAPGMQAVVSRDHLSVSLTVTGLSGAPMESGAGSEGNR